MKIFWKIKDLVETVINTKKIFEISHTSLTCIHRLRDNIPLKENDRIRIFSDDRGNAKLQIKDVHDYDGGLYFCAAENKAGKTKTCCTLRVAGIFDKNLSTNTSLI